MPAASLRNAPIGNRLLDLLTPDVLARLRPYLKPVKLALSAPVPMTGTVIFPTSGMISLVAVMRDGQAVEIGTVGNEGVFSVSAILDGGTPHQKAMVQVAGNGLKMPAVRLRKEARASEDLNGALLRYVQTILNCTAQSAACNRSHLLEQRCARWLLTTRDRVDSDTFPMTHEFLAMMLGVRRPGVTVAAQSLREAGLIAYNHGTITIIDRTGLESASCECYGWIRQEYQRLMNPKRHRGAPHRRTSRDRLSARNPTPATSRRAKRKPTADPIVG